MGCHKGLKDYQDGCKEAWVVLIGRRGVSWANNFSFYKKHVKN